MGKVDWKHKMHIAEKSILTLGTALIKELELDDADTLDRWMAHHIADLMYRAENTTGPGKPEAERECRNAIVELWKHRAGHSRRLDRFGRSESLLQLLRRNRWERLSPPKSVSHSDEKESDNWFRAAQELRESFEELQRVAFELAARAIPESERNSLDAAKGSSLLDKDAELLSTLVRWSKIEAKRKTDWAAIAQSAKGNIDSICEELIHKLQHETGKRGD
ncbi:hypothetical protein K3720_04375 [Leisingera caerulea]|uniref:hypothetical protein n=1 Tax=Leisingera caerulea TaxID=506591 RepID=UPI0021A806C7|nr:hypothetical protein [Leisingera caerulea]UWQ50649.1 hypothetical protein K3720_04375 [Leisingera caerulea]